MWKYVRKYLFFAVLAALFMMGEVMMDLVQPSFISRIVDDGVLMLVMLFRNISRGYVSWKRVKEVSDSEPELKDGNFDGNTDCKGTVKFRDVSFAYPNSNQTVFKNINFKVRQGETVAIMGTTGCGKSSFVNLIPRFYDVTSDAVLWTAWT